MGVPKTEQFINRKRQHLELALQDEMQAIESASLNRVQLNHDSLPDLDLREVSIESSFLDRPIATPYYVAGMTAGHEQAEEINSRLAEACASRGWLFGIGSQRREIDTEIEAEFTDSANSHLISRFPQLKLIANLGITQLIELHRKNEFSKFFKVLDRTRASLAAIHLNPLQEAIQPEGTPYFRGSFSALSEFVAQCPIPVMVKETGTGMGINTLRKLSQLNLFAVDVSGLGGTHWGRIEGRRAEVNSVSAALGEAFSNWGVTTLESVRNATAVIENTEIWASGGMRTGVDAAKLLCLGANRIGFAKPALESALKSADALDHWMATKEQELRVALFCTNSLSIADLNPTKITLCGVTLHG